MTNIHPDVRIAASIDLLHRRPDLADVSVAGRLVEGAMSS